MTCFECQCGSLMPAEVSMTGTRQGESFTVRLQGFRCEACGFETVDSEQSGEFTRLVSDAYRTSHRLLTGKEIRACRAQLGMSQQEFATYLGTGSASVKRWEIGQIQDKAMDELIRLKTDPHAARANLQRLERQIPEQFVVSEGKDVTLVFTSTEYGKYVHPHAMTIETFAVVNRDDLTVPDSCLAA
jgi:putative zinc finger/helix-turn-helix YgiT family protein